ncbi:hypothetical protein [Streptomyces sp. G-G2]|uniref:hypothetical protein n=1 Tax=Streptomyces sp. G-G2 TaxID=3046201 RepID=UPI0024BA53E4|nr:hypothetical protein [Streptomyces sp. G-G2]MDJ0382246.1 hypothetical protein [Streptomyces sp. G-G2]
MKSNPLLSFAPWIAFSEAAGTGLAPQWSAALAALVSLAIASPALVRGKVMLLDAMGVLTFAALSATAWIGGHGAQVFVTDYGRTVATAALAVLIFLTLPFMPFTEQYARQEVPEAAWSSPVFKKTNRLFSAAWGGVFALMTLAHLIALAAPANGDLNWICNWGVPIASVVLMFKFMKRYRAEHTPRQPVLVKQAV